jgi:putative exosortase-associated protein (TIGR04073 family)
MKKFFIVALVMLMFLSMVPLNYALTPSDKLTRGVANVPVGAILEIPKNIDREWATSKNAAIGIGVGIFKGLAMALGRLGSGLWDILTFPMSLPKDFEPIMKPAYVFDKE